LVSKALGHANLSTTQIYLHLEDSELEAAMKRLGG
jgi:site-specific recombinase XerD